MLANRPKLIIFIYEATVAESTPDRSLEALKLSSCQIFSDNPIVG